jgi:hypothetical protein
MTSTWRKMQQKLQNRLTNTLAYGNLGLNPTTLKPRPSKFGATQIAAQYNIALRLFLARKNLVEEPYTQQGKPC